VGQRPAAGGLHRAHPAAALRAACRRRHGAAPARFLRQSRQALQRCASVSKAARRKAARHRKNLALLGVISLTFCLEWLPITIVNIIADVHPEMFPSACAFRLTYALCLLLALASVFVNPLVYGCFNSNFRRDLSHLFGASDAQRDGVTGDLARATSSWTLSRFYTTRTSLLRQLSYNVDSTAVYSTSSGGPAVTPCKASLNSLNSASGKMDTAGSVPDVGQVVVMGRNSLARVAVTSVNGAKVKHTKYLRHRWASLDSSVINILLKEHTKNTKATPKRYIKRNGSLDSNVFKASLPSQPEVIRLMKTEGRKMSSPPELPCVHK
jgi:hypothetical protein